MNIKIKKPKTRQEKAFGILLNSPLFWDLIKEAKHKVQNTNDKVAKEKLLTAESKEIVRKLSLPSEWEMSVKECLISGKLTLPMTPNCQIIFERDFNTGKTELLLKIFAKTTLNDVKENWVSIKKFQKLLPEIQAKEISDQELQIYKWKKEGKKPSWITSVNGGGLTMHTPNNINQIYSRLKKLLG